MFRPELLELSVSFRCSLNWEPTASCAMVMKVNVERNHKLEHRKLIYYLERDQWESRRQRREYALP